jgi:hypothetical protein
MQTLPTPTRRLPEHPEQVQRRLARTVRRCHAAGVAVQPLGVGTFTRQPFVFADSGSDWIVLPTNADPTLRNGQVVIPAVHRRRLLRIAHVELSELLIAHETPTGWADHPVTTPRALTERELDRFGVEASVPAPLGTVALGARLGTGAATIGRAIGVTVAGVAGGGAAVAAMAGMAATALLDPVLIGVIGERSEIVEGEPAGFVVLARWEW